MESFQVRTYGPSPCRAAVLHGGPGAIGSAAGLARGLAESCGVLEPLQSKYSVTEQVEELHRQLTVYASRPLVGSMAGGAVRRAPSRSGRQAGPGRLRTAGSRLPAAA